MRRKTRFEVEKNKERYLAGRACEKQGLPEIQGGEGVHVQR